MRIRRESLAQNHRVAESFFTVVMLTVSGLISFPLINGYILDVFGRRPGTVDMVILLVVEATIAVVAFIRFRPGPYRLQPIRLAAGGFATLAALTVVLYIAWPSLLPVSTSVDVVHHYSHHYRMIDSVDLSSTSGYPFGAVMMFVLIAQALQLPTILLMHPTAALAVAITVLFAYAVTTEMTEDTALSHGLAMVVLLVYFWPVAYTIGQFTRDFFLTQTLGVAYLVGLWYWMIRYVRNSGRLALVPIILLGVSLVFTYPTLIPIFAFTMVVAPLLAECGRDWRRWLVDVAVVAVPLAIVSLVYLWDKVALGIHIVRFEAHTVSPSLESLPIGLVILAGVGLSFGMMRARLRPASTLVWATLLQTIGFYIAVRFFGELSYYHTNKMFFVVAPELAVLASVSIVGATTLLRTPAVGVPNLRVAISAVLVLLSAILVGITWSRSFGDLDPSNWTEGPLNPDLVASAEWAGDNLREQPIVYFTEDWIVAYWVEHGYLRGSKAELLSRPRLKTSLANYSDWKSGKFPEQYAFLPTCFDSLVGSEVETLFRSGNVGVVRRQLSSGAQLVEARPADHTKHLVYRIGSEIGLSAINLIRQRYEPGELLEISVVGSVLEELESHYVIQARLRDWRGETRSISDTPIVPLERTPNVCPNYEFAHNIGLQSDRSTPPGRYQVEIIFFRVPFWATVKVANSNSPSGNSILVGPTIIASEADLPGDEVQPENPLAVRLGSHLEMVGFDSVVVEEDAILLDLYWRALAKLERDYTVFIHLINEQGELAAQLDSYPWGGGYPTSVWDAGQLVRDRYRFNLPDMLTAGEYKLIAGLYLLETMQRLPVTDQQGNLVADHVVLTTLTISDN